MQFIQLKNEALKLSAHQRADLINALVESLQSPPPPNKDRTNAIQTMRGLLKTNQPTPSDEDIAKMREERLFEKYMK
jgi:hypothetical protein